MFEASKQTHGAFFLKAKMRIRLYLLLSYNQVFKLPLYSTRYTSENQEIQFRFQFPYLDSLCLYQLC